MSSRRFFVPFYIRRKTTRRASRRSKLTWHDANTSIKYVMLPALYYVRHHTYVRCDVSTEPGT